MGSTEGALTVVRRERTGVAFLRGQPPDTDHEQRTRRIAGESAGSRQKGPAMELMARAQREVAGMINSGTPFDAIEDQIHHIPDLVDDQRSALWLYAWSRQGDQLATACLDPAPSVGRECGLDQCSDE